MNNPFSQHDGRLRSLSSGLVANDDDNINCDDAEKIGVAIQSRWNNLRFTDISSKKVDQVRSLSHLQKNCSVGKKELLMDANSLFNRLVILVQRSEDIPSFFAFELTSIPTALFKDRFMRKPDKPALVKAITIGLSSNEPPTNIRYVLDGGSLLHRVRWLKGSTYHDISEQYVTYVLKKYGHNSVIVFEGYLNGPSCKDHEHQRRAGKASKMSSDILVDDSKPVVVDQQAFLANENNKNSFIQLLRSHFASSSIETHQSDGDADTDIVYAALTLGARNEQVGVVANDTDILVLLVHHVTPEMPAIYFISEAKKTNKTPTKYINIHQVQRNIGPTACQQILAIHAFG